MSLYLLSTLDLTLRMEDVDVAVGIKDATVGNILDSVCEGVRCITLSDERRCRLDERRQSRPHIAITGERKARTVVGRGQTSLLCDAGSGSRLLFVGSENEGRNVVPWYIASAEKKAIAVV